MNRETLAKIIGVVASVIAKTLRIELLNDSHYYPSQSVYSFWHGNEFTMLILSKNSNIVIMASKSKDGELMAGVLKYFGYQVVRGSSSRGGERGLIELIRYAKNGNNLAFAVDGPRGPYHVVKPGVIYAAQKTGLPVIAVCSSSKNRFIFQKSWDKLNISLPFSKTVQIWSNPIYVKPEDDIEAKRIEVEKEMLRLFEFTDKIFWTKKIPKYLEFHPFPKILIVQPSRLGDIIFSLPVLAALKRKYPHAKISWIVDERCAEILQGNTLLDNIFIWDRTKRSYSYYKELKNRLRAQKFDLSIDLHGLAKSAMLVRLAKARFKLASSSTNGMRELSWLFSKEIKSNDPHAHCIERHMEVSKYLGCDEKIEYPISIAESDFESVRKKLAAEKVDVTKIAGIHAGGGWLSRRWKPERYAALAQRLKNELGADIVLVGGREGGSSEKGLNEEIISQAGVEICDLTGKLTLKELCAFFKLCRVFIANEAGPMHIATALQTPSVAILGPTNAKRTGPFGGKTKIIQHQFSCQPCRNRNCKNVLCMDDIKISEVFDEVKKKYENTDN
ncbi:MAG: DUF374 domain-containing protein [Endomicrobium sp.]|jgi:lipopolysaccharide heptosyltransferase II|nr:DUF374 domain-containing protein [Endomicrobium sp.]